MVTYRESVAGSVIQATRTVEFEDGLRMGVLPEGCWGNAFIFENAESFYGMFLARFIFSSKTMNKKV